MRRFTLQLSLLAVLLIAILAGCGTQTGGSQPGGGNGLEGQNGQTYTMKLAHDMMPDTPFQQSALKFKELVEERTNGRIKVEVYPAQQLGSAREMIEGLQLGTIEGVLLPSAKFGGFDQRLTILDLPFLFPNEDVMWKVLEGPIGRELMDNLKSIGLRGVCVYAEGFKAFTNNKPIHKPEDFRGQKIRVMEAPVIVSTYKAWGANPVPIDYHEVYNALQQGVVDGHENPLLSIVAMKFYEVQKYIILSEHAYLPYVLVLSDKWFSSLPEDLQQIVFDTGLEVAQYHKQLMAEAEEGYLEEIKSSGKTTVYALTPEEKEAFRVASQPVYEEFKNVIGEDLLNRTLKAVEEAS
ncbi:MAG TPA: C4-dicarboxylate ABC transporter substrate-binding protein [Peptococcaceae bacterium]|nr:MAG: Tripartite ATP-independent periplasmic transporter solute receptor, DctP family [Moorella sp. 60_41]HBT46289.1 C4-dicarboxylate ABC transporter substrate-binding protein [Peptococcaceae bacterium]